ncbi:expressed protein [Echinococcus multilocularis]|uniref:Expressed protein n=1 Tax=Echinococcus multilocularis TaxID=6211 RepID=A0A068XWT2_ECHMU|nr:expressed protein [Echinococcus multilocularis]
MEREPDLSKVKKVGAVLGICHAALNSQHTLIDAMRYFNECVKHELNLERAHSTPTQMPLCLYMRYMWGSVFTASVRVISASGSEMSVQIGEAIVLYAVLLLNIVAFTNDGWICGSLYSQTCLEASYVIVVVVGVLATAIVLSLIVAILQTVVAFIDPDSSTSRRLQVSVKVLACLVAILDVFAIFYYYSHLTIRMWGHIIAALCAGMAMAITTTKLSYGYIADQ